MTLPTAKTSATRTGEKRGVECDGKSGRRDEGSRVTSRSSHQRLFCGFDPHWLANDEHFSHPSSFRRYSPPSSSYLSSLLRTRIPPSALSLLFHTPSPNSPQEFFIRTFASFTSKVSFFIEVLLG